MKRKTTMILVFFTIIMLMILTAAVPYVREQDVPFPRYGTGPIQVRIYTDYFCPPCRAMKPHVEPVLQDLLKRNAITLIWVDTPFYRHSALYAKYFLYALKEKNDADYASRVRNVLNDATLDRQITTEARIEALFKSKDIPYTVFEASPVFERYNALIKEDKIQATPTCVIVRNGKKESFVGGPDIVAALKRLP